LRNSTSTAAATSPSASWLQLTPTDTD
jgi:hypothetical protein